MSQSELEQRAIKELLEETQQRLELETKNLDSARFEFTKLQIRIKLFGKENLDQKEHEAFAHSYPEHIAKHDAGLAALQEQLDKLRAYGQDGGQAKAAQGGGHQSHV